MSDAPKKTFWTKTSGVLVVIGVGAILVVTALRMTDDQSEPPNQIESPKHVKMSKPSPKVASFAAVPEVISFGTNKVSIWAVDDPSEPTINPADPYDPMPLRVGTVGATTYHRPFCPYAKKSLATHGLEKRINYWTREHVADSSRPADTYCIANVFDCSDVEPTDFAASGNDPWCGANIPIARYTIDGIDDALLGKTLCKLSGFIGIFVDDSAHCRNGSVIGSDLNCDMAACGNCTDDCDTVCDGCVKVTMAVLNKITLSMGDANKDGQANIADYPYFHECYSGVIAATITCQNIFDFDNDADVDTTDFDLFVQAYDTGNESWAASNHPNALINPSKLELPLRVGTDGSVIYHRLDCPAVNNSWETHGLEKRAEFYTWDQVEDSGRTPDTNICLPGTRSNPSGSLQNCTLDDDEDGTLNCDDGCPEDVNKIVAGLCGCGVVDADPCP